MNYELWMVTGASNVTEENKVFKSRELALEYVTNASVGFDVVVHTDYVPTVQKKNEPIIPNKYQFVKRKFFSYPGGVIIWGAPIA